MGDKGIGQITAKGGRWSPSMEGQMVPGLGQKEAGEGQWDLGLCSYIFVL